MHHVTKNLPLQDECSGLVELNKQLARRLPPIISPVGWFAIGMVAGALVVAAAVFIFK